MWGEGAEACKVNSCRVWGKAAEEITELQEVLVSGQ